MAWTAANYWKNHFFLFSFTFAEPWNLLLNLVDRKNTVYASILDLVYTVMMLILSFYDLLDNFGNRQGFHSDADPDPACENYAESGSTSLLKT